MDGLILSMIIAFCIMGVLYFLGAAIVLLFNVFGWIGILVVVVFIVITIVVYNGLDI